VSGTRRSLSSLYTLLADNTAGDISAQDVRDLAASTFPVVLPLPQGRLTTESGVAVSTSDRTSQSTLFYTPYTGNGIWLYDGTIWQPYAFTERSLTLSGLTSGTNYDVFLFDNAGALTLELTAWTNNTTRATALATQDGILVRSGALTRRYLGTIRATGTTTTEDSRARRFVWNFYSRIERQLRIIETTDSWTYASTAWRQARASTANQVEFVIGESQFVNCALVGNTFNSTLTARWIAIGLDSTTAPSADCLNGVSYGTNSDIPCTAIYRGLPSPGYHFLAWLEKSDGATNTFSGDAASDGRNTGLMGGILC
jgi:hypothetical protein